MKKIDEITQKKILIEILNNINEICKENEIVYYLDSGTLLGAIRHRGFIPWDDDIDICMFRDHYEKFLKLMDKDGRFKILTYKSAKNYGQAYAKVVDSDTLLVYKNVDFIEEMGINIDVFPIDVVPKYQVQKFIYFSKIWYLRKLMLLSARNSLEESGKLKRVIWRALRDLKQINFTEIIDNEAKKYRNHCTGEVTSILPSLTKYKILKKEWFSEQKFVEFETLLVPIPSGALDILDYQYGNFMELPPKEQQVSHHEADAFYRNKK